MEIEELSILSEYKNLKGLKIQFSPKRNTYILIGNNGAGKSNVLEAISSIFRGLYYEKAGFEFDFNIRYSIDGKKVVITHKNGNIKKEMAKMPVRQGDNSYLPRKIVCNYSGEDSRLNEQYYKPIYDNYINSLKSASKYETLNMIFVDKSYWKVILLIMLATRQEMASFNKFLKDIIGVKDNSSIKVHLRIDNNKIKSWSSNPSTFYLATLAANIDNDGTLPIDKVNINNNNIASDLFNYFVSVKDVINELSININGYDSSMLSEGEKKLMVVEFILEAISDENSLILLDEPDSHIHVSRKIELKDYLEATANRENIITSHSPSLTAAFDRDAIIMLSNEKGNAEVVNDDKRRIVETLTNNIWTVQEQNIFLTSNKDILIVEGITDEGYLKSALKAFHKQGLYEDIDFDCLPSGGAAQVETIIQKFRPKENQLAIAIWDNDGAGQDSMKKVFKEKPLPYAKKKEDIWYTFYPTWKKSIKNFNVEDYFNLRILYSYTKISEGFSSLSNKNKVKENLSKDCINGKYLYKDFRHFKKLFDLIRKIKKANNDKLCEIIGPD